MNKSVDFIPDMNNHSVMEHSHSSAKREVCSFHIGLILPVNTEQRIAKYFQNGVKSIVENTKESHVQISTELVAQSTLARYTEAVSKLFEFEEVDLIIGFFSTHEVSAIAKLSEKFKKPIIACHLGEHLPLYTEKYAYLYVYSLSVWQHVWVLGRWTATTLGPKGLFIYDLYDGGYAFGAMFDLGMKQDSPESKLSFHMLSNTQEGSLDMTALFNLLEHDRPDFIYSSLNGAQAGRFLDAFANSSYANIPLVGLPFLLDNGTSTPENIRAYTSSILSADTVDSIYSNWGKNLAILVNNIFSSQEESVQKLQSSSKELLGTWQLKELAADIVINRKNSKADDSVGEKNIVYHVTPPDAGNKSLLSLLTDINSAWTNSYLTR